MSRTILVTGASKGIGRATTERLLKDGHSVIGVARRFSRAETGPNFHRVEVDLSDLDALPDRLKGLVKEFPAIDAIVFNAGRGLFGGIEQYSYAEMRSLIDLNFTHHAYVARAFVPEMKRRGRGDLIFIGSEAALSGKQKGSLYCASKFALRGFAQAMREECSASGIRVTSIHPGMVKTEFFDALDIYPGADPENYVVPENVADTVAMVLASRPETNFDEIVLSPLKKVVRFRSQEKKESH